MNKIEKVNTQDPPALGKRWGDPLPNMAPMTPSEVVMSPMFRETPKATGLKYIESTMLEAVGIKVDIEGTLAFRWMMFEDGSGVAILRDFTPAFFKFATCIHRFGPQVKIGNCLHRKTCEICTYSEEVDSSG